MSCCSACGTHACACGCGATAGTPLPLYNRPGLAGLAYRVGTYADFRATMQRDLSAAALPALAALRTREQDDPAMALLDAWAVGADVLMFYQERIANEGYLRTATERRSVLELARLLDYRLRPGVAASVYLAYTVENDSPPVTIAAGARAQSVPAIHSSPRPATLSSVMFCGRVSRGCSAFHSKRASSGSAVSKVCICSPGAGTDCARAPAGMVTGGESFSTV